MTADKPRLTLSMVVRNESGRYLRQALERHRRFIDDAVIIDDGSTDDTPEICQRALEGVPLRLIRNGESRFGREVLLRKQQWEETIAAQPEWILNLDADEWFEDRFGDEVGALLADRDSDLISFRLYDFWNEGAYREDRFWQAHLYYRPFLLRYRPDFAYRWKDADQHCGRFPENVYELPNKISPLRLKHFGWATAADRVNKFQRYMRFDPEGKYGWLEQYYSILDEHPQLVKWEE